ncbi:MAG: MATE family efflux transporter [Niameybacter sp.]|uniref:MATE family efflux transporter n=1 Tax=Niameybacter sp. TaxID=2033640 RepID=UPI002FC91B26
MKQKTTDLGKDNVGGLLFKLALPAIIAQLVNVLYNIVDRMYIGRLPDSNAMAGVGIAFPVIIIVSAFSALVGMGGAPLVAIKLGEKNKDGAEQIMTTSFSMLIIVGALLMAVLLMFQEPILWAFGASEATIGYATQYLTIYLIGTIAVQLALGMNSFINTQGFAKIGMCTVLLGAVINIVLDPIFIFGFGMGVQGAALATILAQCVSALWVIYFFFGKEKQFKNTLLNELVGKKSTIKIRKEYLVPNMSVGLKIMSLGISPFIMQSTESLVLISLNNQLLTYGNLLGDGVGNLAIGSMTIMGSIMQIVSLPMFGLTQGAQPIISYNYGAKQFDRVKKTFKLTLASCLAFTGLMWLLIMFVPEILVKLFNSTPEVMDMTTWSMRIFFAGLFMMGAQTACQQTFLALGQAKISLFLALLRKIILLIPLVFILPLLMENQLAGVFMAEPVADILAGLTTLICFGIFYKKTFKNLE